MSESDASAESFSQDVISAVRLAMVSGVGPLLRRELLSHFGTPAAILAAAPSELCRVRGIGPTLAKRIAAAEETIDVEAELRIASQHGLRLMLDTDDDFPRLLAEIHDPPGLLFVRGQILPSDRLAVGIVGMRHASRYGLVQAERLASGLARAGITVVSGLARGIDGAAHRGALAAGGRTIAILASGLVNIYPPEHVPLADAIVAAGGALLSEQPPRMEPLSGMFPQRNRIISGLSLGVIVVEAAHRSGALITARHAMEQGRDVFAVPGRVDQRQSRGCHQLIRDGATLVESVDDILDELGPLVETTPRGDGRTVRHPAELKLNEIEQQVLQAIDTTPTMIDTVTALCGLPVHRVLSTISVLEMRRLIRRVSGNLVERV
ncbi:MAG: DNA-processing protein DprA [Pirellulales bacterium]|nr:DNA-processing protein DprA [Pirellulales bacterium]